MKKKALSLFALLLAVLYFLGASENMPDQNHMTTPAAPATLAFTAP